MTRLAMVESGLRRGRFQVEEKDSFVGAGGSAEKVRIRSVRETPQAWASCCWYSREGFFGGFLGAVD